MGQHLLGSWYLGAAAKTITLNLARRICWLPKYKVSSRSISFNKGVEESAGNFLVFSGKKIGGCNLPPLPFVPATISLEN